MNCLNDCCTCAVSAINWKLDLIPRLASKSSQIYELYVTCWFYFLILMLYILRPSSLYCGLRYLLIMDRYWEISIFLIRHFFQDDSKIIDSLFSSHTDMSPIPIIIAFIQHPKLVRVTLSSHIWCPVCDSLVGGKKSSVAGIYWVYLQVFQRACWCCETVLDTHPKNCKYFFFL